LNRERSVRRSTAAPSGAADDLPRAHGDGVDHRLHRILRCAACAGGLPVTEIIRRVVPTVHALVLRPASGPLRKGTADVSATGPLPLLARRRAQPPNRRRSGCTTYQEVPAQA